MKGKNFLFRLGCACNGFAQALRRESSFRIQVLAAMLALGSMILIRPTLIWAALVVITVCLVLAAELVNTALEHTLDGLHPQNAEFVRIAKDCAAAAVLILAMASVVIYLMMLLAIS
ncbi:MAG: diacylglycerol kinase [Burkholderiales bacterium]|nr:diacylglycerol kinase [Burkholderiales bacterium]